MKVLYLNNYRGFAETFIPLYKVNFFVGENSTGKSSVLSLLKLMSNAQFWNFDEFNTEEIELGFFDELVSHGLKGKKYFQLGYFNEDSDESTYPYVLAKYVNERGEPRLSELRIALKNHSILIVFNNTQYKIKYKQVDLEKPSLESFKTWIEDTDFTGIKFQIVKAEGFINRYYEIRSALRKILSKDIIPIGGFSRPILTPTITWIAPIRTKPKRIYEYFKLTYSPEGNHIPLLIKNVLSNNLKHNISKSDFLSALENFGKESGLFDKIDIKNLGEDSSSSFIVNVFLNNVPLKITNVGYGVGQVLPFLTEVLTSTDNKWLCIQQPEVHLHPRAQAALGEFIFSAAVNKGEHFLIETHSDFIIDRYRLCLKRGRKKIESQVLFFERRNGRNYITPIPIGKDGHYEEDQPKNFRTFFINEELNLLTI